MRPILLVNKVRSSASCSACKSRLGIIPHWIGDVKRRMSFFVSVQWVYVLHSVVLDPPSLCHWIPLESSTAVRCPCADGCFEKCVRARLHGDPHIIKTQTTRSTSGISRSEAVWSPGCLILHTNLQVTTEARATTMNLKPHFIQVFRLRIAMNASKKSRCLKVNVTCIAPDCTLCRIVGDNRPLRKCALVLRLGANQLVIRRCFNNYRLLPKQPQFLRDANLAQKVIRPS